MTDPDDIRWEVVDDEILAENLALKARITQLTARMSRAYDLLTEATAILGDPAGDKELRQLLTLKDQP